MDRFSLSRKLAVALALSCAGALAQAPRDAPLVVGSVRADARAYPFARLAGGAWQSSVAADDLPERWSLISLISDVKPGTARRTSAPQHVEDVCDDVPMFQTDIPAVPRLIEPDTCPMPIVGLLFSTPVEMFEAEGIAGTEPVARRIAAYVADRIKGFEARTAKEVGDLGLSVMGIGCRKKAERAPDADQWACESPSAEMRLVGLQPPGSAQRFFRVQYTARGRRHKLSEYEFGETFYTGWLSLKQDRITTLREQFFLPDMDYKIVDDFEEPLLGFTHARRAYVVSQVHGWESQEHVVSELTPTGVTPQARLMNHAF